MTHSSPKLYALTALIILCAIALRVLHIDADTPSGLSWSAGLYVDEGYKTLSPRNLSLFDKTHWHPADTYPGWMDYSPLTQWPVYAVFKSFGTSITAARSVPIIYFSLLALVISYFLRRRYSTNLFYVGLILFLVDASLFTFSRVALFEIPMSFFLYGLILPLSLLRENKQPTLLPILWLTIGGVLIGNLIKLSALVYIAPALIAASTLYIINKIHLAKKQSIILLVIFSLASLILLAVTHHAWGHRLGISPLDFIYKMIENPLRITSPAILIAGTLCAAHIAAYQSRLYLNNIYRVCLLSMVIMAPLILSLFPYNPLRYYIPFVPAYILLILEWFHTTTNSEISRERPHFIASLIGLLLTALAIAYSFTALNLHEHIQMRFIIVISACAASVIWFFQHSLFSEKGLRTVLTGFVGASLLHSLFLIGSFHMNPIYNSETMRSRISQVVKEGETVSGGWAPFLLLGTSIKVIYANNEFNTPDVLKIIQPDYFVQSDTPTSMKTLELIKQEPGVSLGKPAELGLYNEIRVRMYPLIFRNATE